MKVTSSDSLGVRYTLSEEQVAAFRHNGHVCLPQVLHADDMPAWRSRIAAAADRHNPETRPLAERDTYHRAFLQTCNLWKRDEEVARYVLAKRFARIAAELMGVASVRLYHDQALFKEPGGGFTPWHQDQYYWPLATPHTITMWMPLVDVAEDMGMMEFVSGTQRLGAIARQAISDDSEIFFNNFLAREGLAPIGPSRARAGDATFHAGWTLHRAGPNTSSRRREVMTVIYFADGACIDDPVRPESQADLDAWLGGRAPGSAAATELNPIIWKG